VIREDYLQHNIKLTNGDTAIDIGANFGAFTVLAAKRVGDSGRVFAFEPNPTVCDRLRKNIELNGLSNVSIFNEAVGDREDSVRLHLSPKSAYNTVCNEVDGRSFSDSQSVTVKMRPMSSVIALAGNHVDLLKLDCEGSEYAILDHLDDVNAAAIKQISMEIHSIKGRSTEDIYHRLKELGFVAHRTYPITAFRHTDQ